MTPLQSLLSLASEPASIIYIATGAIGFVFTRLRGTRPGESSVAMLFCRRSSRAALESLHLL
jgi:hypothetical protein